MTKAERADPLMLTEYSDILTARQTAKILGIGHHQGYQMIDRLFGLKLSGSYKIAKLIEDFLDSTADDGRACHLHREFAGGSGGGGTC